LKEDRTAPSVEKPIPPDTQPDDPEESEDSGDPKLVDNAGAKTPGERKSTGRSDKMGEAEKGERQKLGEAEKGDRQQFNAELEKITGAALAKNAAEREERQFSAAEFALRQAIQDIPELKSLAENLIVDRTPEGLRIQLVDQDKLSMFTSGSSDMAEPAKKLMALVSQVVQRLPNKVSLSGHTDATPFARTGNYGNWELSTDRANASRRALLAAGLPPDRIAKVVGVADRDPLITDHPTSPQNRRISIVLLKDAKPTASLAQVR
jgi:chemotaxis protein MotB